MTTLKPCPFCGSKEISFSRHPEWCFLHMLNNKDIDESWTSNIEKIHTAWNTRQYPKCDSCKYYVRKEKACDNPRVLNVVDDCFYTAKPKEFGCNHHVMKEE